MCFKAKDDVPQASEALQSWIGYMIHVSETCEPSLPFLLTQVHTTTAAVHESQCTEDIHQALVDKALPPDEHWVDAAYIDAALLVQSQEQYGITLRGPTRPNPMWYTHVPGAYAATDFTIDWAQQQVHCPQGKTSANWVERSDAAGNHWIQVRFSSHDCTACPVRPLCTQAKRAPRSLKLQPQAHYEALHAAREWFASPEGQERYKRRAAIEGTLSQGVRAFGMRRTRYRGLAKTHVQHLAIAAAINIDRLIAWFDARPRAQTRTSRFAALAPAGPAAPRTLTASL